MFKFKINCKLEAKLKCKNPPPRSKKIKLIATKSILFFIVFFPLSIFNCQNSSDVIPSNPNYLNKPSNLKVDVINDLSEKISKSSNFKKIIDGFYNINKKTYEGKFTKKDKKDDSTLEKELKKAKNREDAIKIFDTYIASPEGYIGDLDKITLSAVQLSQEFEVSKLNLTEIELNTVFNLSIKKYSDRNKKSLRIGDWCSGICNSYYNSGMYGCDANFLVGVIFAIGAGSYTGPVGYAAGSLAVLALYGQRWVCYSTTLTNLGICNDGCNPNQVIPPWQIPNYYNI